jgi:hypothetical protein
MNANRRLAVRRAAAGVQHDRYFIVCAFIFPAIDDIPSHSLRMADA